jgi:hypothetical protein
MNAHLFLLLAASPLFAVEPPTNPAILTPEQAIAVRRPGDLQFSPDGKRLAFAVSRPPKGAAAGLEV